MEVANSKDKNLQTVNSFLLFVLNPNLPSRFGCRVKGGKLDLTGQMKFNSGTIHKFEGSENTLYHDLVHLTLLKSLNLTNLYLFSGPIEYLIYYFQISTQTEYEAQVRNKAQQLDPDNAELHQEMEIFELGLYILKVIFKVSNTEIEKVKELDPILKEFFSELKLEQLACYIKLRQDIFSLKQKVIKGPLTIFDARSKVPSLMIQIDSNDRLTELYIQIVEILG